MVASLNVDRLPIASGVIARSVSFGSALLK
jgi:hypothetical protein